MPGTTSHGVCGVSGCGSTAAYLDATTVRTAGWVQVRRAAEPAGSARWFHSLACAARGVGTERLVREDLAATDRAEAGLPCDGAGAGR
ncbi:hypothetical protein [Actinacidiphila sp. ITFR-21]|uniref:hypothetical protein n=1 Tax=Actinacidiphila sp. ITFR-21 TaxID=3075199 RepID=UPI00288B25F0|nr:hypothetical protein [Streptomyces sp. ITFR-21]WNI16647.1 hypothetical protein RLT57_14745 [Streptomyces sp. ITFR-21]